MSFFLVKWSLKVSVAQVLCILLQNATQLKCTKSETTYLTSTMKLWAIKMHLKTNKVLFSETYYFVFVTSKNAIVFLLTQAVQFVKLKGYIYLQFHWATYFFNK